MKRVAKKKSNLASDSILLTFVRCVTLLTTMVQTMLLARIMTLTEYGVYSQLLLVVSIVTTFSGLGLNNAINYFYNKEEQKDKGNYVNHIFSLTIIVGLIAAVLTFILRGAIASYYKNEMITGLIIYIALRPMLANVVGLYQPLYISAGKSKTIAARNFIISVIQAISIPVSFYFTRDLRIVLSIQVLLDVLQIIYFGFDFNRKVLKIKIATMDFTIVKKVLTYSMPLGLALMLGTLFKEADKLVIARLMDESWLAIYTNMSKQLPFEFVVISFTAVITPVIVKLYSKKDINGIKNLWSNYIQFGYLSTWILCAGAIVCAPELLEFLYSSKYMVGLSIFIIYLITEMFRFCYFGLILSATGKTKFILFSSFVTLIINLILNILLYYAIGFIGPAVATLITVIVMNSVQLLISCRQLKIPLLDIINLSGAISVILKYALGAIINSYMIKLIVIYLLFITISGLLLKKDIIFTLKNIKEE